MPKLQHIRSATPDKRPDPALLVDGQLSINTAATTPGVYTKNDAGGLIKVGPTHIGATAPNSTAAGAAGNSVGEHWMDTSVAPPVLRVWDGSAWLVSQGLTGPAGADGATGAQGPAGADGAAGPVGPQGPGGEGSVGATGPQGPPGADSTVPGPQGPAGADSTVPGPQGPAGADGAAGGQGPAGNDGAAGAQGPPGNDGAAGAGGPAGPPGNDGAAGAAGPTGPAGPNAVSADPGNATRLGADGLVYTPTFGSFSDANARNIAGSATTTFEIPSFCKTIIVSWTGCYFSRFNVTFAGFPAAYWGDANYIGGGSGIRHDSPYSWLIGESYSNYLSFGTITINNCYANKWVLTGMFTRYDDSHTYFPTGEVDGGSIVATQLILTHTDAASGFVNIKYSS